MYSPWRPIYPHHTNTIQPHHYTHNRRTLLPTPTYHHRPTNSTYRPPHINYHHNRPTHTYQTTEYTRPRPLYSHTQPHRSHRPPPQSTRPPPAPPVHTHYIAPDAPTREKAKLYFKIIQALHHKNITDRAVSSRELPRGMLRQVQKLAHFIKPAAPTDTTLQKIDDNTNNWMHTNMLILQEHYTHTIDEFTHTPQPTNSLSLKIATNWAHRRFGNRLLPITLDTLQDTLSHTSAPQSTAATNPQPSHSDPSSPTPPSPPTPPPGTWTIASPTSPPHILSQTDFPPLPPPLPTPTTPPTNTYAHSRTLYLGPRPTLFELTTAHPTDPPPTQPALPLPLPARLRGRGRARTFLTRNQNQDTNRGTLHTQHATPIQLPTQLNPLPTHTSPPSPPLPRIRIHHTSLTSISEDQTSISPPPYTTLSPEIPFTPSTHILLATPPLTLNPHKKKIIHTEAQVIHTHNSIPAPTTPYTLTPIRPLPTPHTRNNLTVDLPDTISQKSISPPPLFPTGVTSGLAKNPRVMMKGPTKVNMTATNPIAENSSPLPALTSCQASVNTNPSTPTAPPTPPPPDTQPQFTPSPTNPATLKHYRPVYHKARVGNRLQDWSFQGQKPTLIIGDSNLNRIPPHTHSHIQIDSYPGAHHRTHPPPTPENTNTHSHTNSHPFHRNQQYEP